MVQSTHAADKEPAPIHQWLPATLWGPSFSVWVQAEPSGWDQVLAARSLTALKWFRLRRGREHAQASVTVKVVTFLPQGHAAIILNQVKNPSAWWLKQSKRKVMDSVSPCLTCSSYPASTLHLAQVTSVVPISFSSPDPASWKYLGDSCMTVFFFDQLRLVWDTGSYWLLIQKWFQLSCLPSTKG